MSVVKAVAVDSRGLQLHRLRCTFSSASGTTVVEIVGGVHVPFACKLSQVHCHGVTGACTNYQLDVHEAVGSQSTVPAGSPMLFQGTSTAKAAQSNTVKIGANVLLETGRSLYVRLVPDGGSDNAGVVDVFVIPAVGGE